MKPTIFCLAVCVFGTTFAQEEKTSDPGAHLAVMKDEAAALKPLITSDLAGRFLCAVRDLPPIEETRVLYYESETRWAWTEEESLTLDADFRDSLRRIEADEAFYYTTMYGTPLAYVRVLEIASEHEFGESLDGKRIVDFGFGSIGQLCAMASLGADVTGIDVSELLRKLYSDESDVGRIERGACAGEGGEGTLRLVFGRYPADGEITATVGGGYDLFTSKNTLKRGYIHPPEGVEVDERSLIDLGADDETYCRTVYEALNPGGLFIIYNLHPAQAPEGARYIPWADGRCPFDREVVRGTGFEVIAYDLDDTAWARRMAAALGWDKQMNLENDLFATFTVLRRPAE